MDMDTDTKEIWFSSCKVGVHTNKVLKKERHDANKVLNQLWKRQRFSRFSCVQLRVESENTIFSVQSVQLHYDQLCCFFGCNFFQIFQIEESSENKKN